MCKKMIAATLLSTFLLFTACTNTSHAEIFWVEQPAAQGWHISHPYPVANYADGLYQVAILEDGTGNPSSNGGMSGDFLYGYVDQYGKWLLQPQYTTTTPFVQNWAIVSIISGNEEEKQQVWQIIDKKGQVNPAFAQLVQENIFCQETDGVFFRCGKRVESDDPFTPPTWTFGLYDCDGEEIFPPIYQKLSLPQEGLCTAKINNKFGFYDINGNAVIPAQYENAQNFSEGMAAVRQNGKWGFINREGTMVIAPTYEEVQSFSEGFAAVKQNGQWGFVDVSGKVVIVPQYSEVKGFHEETAAVKQDEQWGVLNQRGEILIPCQYQQVQSACDGRICVQNGEYYGYFDTNGQQCIDFLFTYAKDFHEGYAVAVNRDEQYGLIDSYGKTILDFDYRYISDVTDGTAICQCKNYGKVGIVHLPVEDR